MKRAIRVSAIGAVLPWLIPAATVFAQAIQPTPPPPSTWEDEKGREAYFWEQRSFPSTERPYADMWRVRMSMLSANAFASASSAAPLLGGAWRQLGPAGMFNAETGYWDSSPQLDAGRITAIAPNPKAGGAFFVGSASGGVWRSASLGAGWTALTDNQCTLNIGAMSVDPVNPLNVYVGTGEYNTGSAGCGMLRSIDGGATWTQLGTSSFVFGVESGAAFGHILIDPSTTGSATTTTLLAATNAGLYRSTNGGGNWTVVLTGASSSVIAHPTKSGVRFAGEVDFSNASRRGVYRSIDGGQTWVQLPALPQLLPDSIGRVELAVSAAAPDKILALVAKRSSQLGGLFIWDDAANGWTKAPGANLYNGAARGDFGGQGTYDLAIAVDPRNASRIYVGGIRGFLSTDGGATFSNMGLEIHCDWHVITIDPRNPDVVYAATDGGIFVSTDDGGSWTSRNAGLAIGQFYPGISVSPKGTVVIGGLQDNSTSTYSGSLVWNGSYGTGDGGFTAINYQNPSISWGVGYWSGGPNIARRDGSSITQRTSGIVRTDKASFFPPLIIDPVTPTKLYFGTTRLYRTINEGVTWTPISGDLTSGSLTTMAVAPSDTMTIYTGANDGTVQVSRDGGVTFTRASGLPTRAAKRVVVDPNDATHAWVTYSGFGTGHVFETKNAGVTWTNIGTGLTDAPVNGAVYIPSISALVIASDAGVFATSDGGVTWQPGPTALPNVIVEDVAYSPASNLLVAGTYGRGMFAYAVGGQAAVLRGDVSLDGKLDAFDALLVQQALVALLPPTQAVYPAGDANCNGTLEAADLLLILRAAVGLPTPNACVGSTR